MAIAQHSDSVIHVNAGYNLRRINYPSAVKYNVSCIHIYINELKKNK